MFGFSDKKRPFSHLLTGFTLWLWKWALISVSKDCRQQNLRDYNYCFAVVSLASLWWSLCSSYHLLIYLQPDILSKGHTGITMRQGMCKEFCVRWNYMLINPNGTGLQPDLVIGWQKGHSGIDEGITAEKGTSERRSTKGKVPVAKYTTGTEGEIKQEHWGQNGSIQVLHLRSLPRPVMVTAKILCSKFNLPDL